MKEQPKYVLLDKRQTVGESLVSDGWTFGLLLLCIWASQGSKWCDENPKLTMEMREERSTW
jgi:hypothetical protein